MMVWMGVYPAPFLRRMEASLHAVQQRVHDARGPEGGYHVRNVVGQPRDARSRQMIATYFPIVPLLILVAAGMLVMVLEPFTAPERKARLGQIAVVATALAAYSLAFQWNTPPRTLFRGMFVVDNFSVFFQWLFLVITGISRAGFDQVQRARIASTRGEYYALLLFAVQACR